MNYTIKKITTAELEEYQLWIELGKPTEWLGYDKELYDFIAKNEKKIAKRRYEL